MQETNYVLVTDDTCDMPPEFYAENDIPVLCLTFRFGDETFTSEQMQPPEFYARLRQGQMATTAQVNVEEITQFLEPFLQQGKDVLYIAFSSGLSGTYNSGAIAARDLSERYPERKIRVVDSICASMGEGLLVYKLSEMKRAGKSLEELEEWAETNKHLLAHYVTAEDLMHLHRGGRISKTSAIVGGMLGIKPMIYMDETGHLINYGKVRGRRQSLEAVVNDMAKAVGNAKNDIFFVCHSDSREDAEYVAELAKKRFGIDKYLIHYIGPVIGSHTGPGTIALFLMAEHK